MRAYIHIPFCRKKCTYCKFATAISGNHTKEMRYLGSLVAEIEAYDGEGWLLDSLYFWGGTPSSVSLEYIAKILEVLRRKFFITPWTEISFECNPEDATREYLLGLQKLGINRLSFGIQTLEDASLSLIGRADSSAVFQALDAACSSGFSNINIDFILGLPEVLYGQTLEDIKTLHEKYPLTHTSVYFLEKGIYPKEWQKQSISEEEQKQEYALIRDFLLSKKFTHYEISNFACPWYECRHNLGYWKRESSAGFWLSAASLFHKHSGEGILQVRQENATSLAWYYRGEKEVEILSGESVRIEQILCGLRTFSAPKNLFKDMGKLEEQIALWYIAEADGVVFPTLTWIFILDCIIGELL